MYTVREAKASFAKLVEKAISWRASGYFLWWKAGSEIDSDFPYEKRTPARSMAGQDSHPSQFF
jgi:hypothetical protein